MRESRVRSVGESGLRRSSGVRMRLLGAELFSELTAATGCSFQGARNDALQVRGIHSTQGGLGCASLGGYLRPEACQVAIAGVCQQTCTMEGGDGEPARGVALETQPGGRLCHQLRE